MNRSSVPYRGKAACREEEVEVESVPTVKKPRGGTVGKGTRQGTDRSALKQAAYDWDADGVQLASLHASLIIFRDNASRQRVCSGDGRHQCGLVLVRPRRPQCSAAECHCSADTVAMAARIGADKDKVCAPHRPSLRDAGSPSSHKLTRVSRSLVCPCR